MMYVIKEIWRNMFNAILVQPLINVLTIIYSLLPGHDFGLAIIILTVLVRLLIWPLQSQTLRNQKAMQKIQPEVKKIQQKYKNDPQKMNAMMMELYKEKEVNPFSSCLPSILQIPIMIGLFYALIKFQDPNFTQLITQGKGLSTQLYGWVANLDFVKTALALPFSTTLFGMIDLIKPNIPLAVIAGAVQFIQTKMMLPAKDADQAQNMMAGLTYMFPILTIFIGISFPAALPLYWIVTTGMSILQQYLIMHHDVEVLERGK